MRVRPVLRAEFSHPTIGGVISVGTLAAVLLTARWPFTCSKAVESFERISSSEVRISDFRKIFLPQPGYIAQSVTFTRGGPGNGPLATIRKITCRATWLALITFTHRINSMDLEGLKIEIPAHLPPPVRKHTEAEAKTTVTRLVANGTVLEIASRRGVLPTLRIDFPGLVLGDVGKDKSIMVWAHVQNPNPPGDLRVSGSVGPLVLGKIAQTPVSGVFQLLRADLGAYKVIDGNLTSAGRFDGTLGRAEVSGRAEIPDFEVTSSHHSLGLTTEYRAAVDGVTGDVAIESAQTHFLGTTLVAQGA
jgi:hypothetical protein